MRKSIALTSFPCKSLFLNTIDSQVSITLASTPECTKYKNLLPWAGEKDFPIKPLAPRVCFGAEFISVCVIQNGYTIPSLSF